MSYKTRTFTHGRVRRSRTRLQSSGLGLRAPGAAAEPRTPVDGSGGDVASIGQPRQIGARLGFVHAAVLAAKSLLISRGRAKPGRAARGGHHRHVTETSLQPRADSLKQLARGPYIGTAVKPCRQLFDDGDDMLGVYVQKDVARGSRRPRL